MIKSVAKAILIFLLISNSLEAATVVDHYSNDDYVLEHQVSYDEAIINARNFTVPKGPIPGCKLCTSDEMTYCKDGSVISDHCCCDGGYNKVFPFVEHVCRIERQGCKLQVDNCAEYARLRDCCCISYLGSYWKYRAGGVDAAKPSLQIFLGTITLCIIQRII